MHAFFGMIYTLRELREEIKGKFEPWKLALEAREFCLNRI